MSDKCAVDKNKPCQPWCHWDCLLKMSYTESEAKEIARISRYAKEHGISEFEAEQVLKGRVK